MYRHPRETLSFFGVGADETVIEITPGGGWYAEILAPYLRDNGHYVAAVWDDAIPGSPATATASTRELRAKFSGNAAVYGAPVVRVRPEGAVFDPAASADTVLTFRNAHNWVSDGNADSYFKAFFDVLKPGGTLGVVDHRAKPDTDLETMKGSRATSHETLVIDPRARPASCSRRRARSTPTRRTTRTIRTACGRCRRRCGPARKTGTSTSRSAKATASRCGSFGPDGRDSELGIRNGGTASSNLQSRIPNPGLHADRLQQTLWRAVPVHDRSTPPR
jgi:hypothetical protein